MLRSKEKQRCFVALHVGERLPASALQAVKKLKINADQREMDIKWSPLANLHITLVFFGEVDAHSLESIRQNLRHLTIDGPPTQVDLHGLGGYGDNHHARVLWMGVRNSKALRHLQGQVLESVRPWEKNEFSAFEPHLTLGRLRNPRSIDDLISPFVRKEFGHCSVSGLTLFRSHLQGHFPTYVPIEHFPFAPALAMAE